MGITFLACVLLAPEAERSPVRFHLHKGRTLSLRKWLKPIVVAICVSTHSTKEALPSSLQIEAFWLWTFYTRDFHLVLSLRTLSIFCVVARTWPLHTKVHNFIRKSKDLQVAKSPSSQMANCPYSSNSLGYIPNFWRQGAFYCRGVPWFYWLNSPSRSFLQFLELTFLWFLLLTYWGSPVSWSERRLDSACLFASLMSSVLCSCWLVFSNTLFEHKVIITIGNPCNDALHSKLPSLQRNPSCDGVCTWCWREYYVKWEFVQKQGSQGKTERHLYISIR